MVVVAALSGTSSSSSSGTSSGRKSSSSTSSPTKRRKLTRSGARGTSDPRPAAKPWEPSGSGLRRRPWRERKPLNLILFMQFRYVGFQGSRSIMFRLVHEWAPTDKGSWSLYEHSCAQMSRPLSG